jgi:hypothetical protein
MAFRRSGVRVPSAPPNSQVEPPLLSAKGVFSCASHPHRRARSPRLNLCRRRGAWSSSARSWSWCCCWALQVACAGPAPTAVPAPQSTPTGPLSVALSLEAARCCGRQYPAELWRGEPRRPGRLSGPLRDVGDLSRRGPGTAGVVLALRYQLPGQPGAAGQHLAQPPDGPSWRPVLTTRGPWPMAIAPWARPGNTAQGGRLWQFDDCAVQQEMISPAFQVQ